MNTNSSNGSRLASSNKRNKYFNVSARKKLSILSLKTTGSDLTDLMEEYPPDGTRACFLSAVKMAHPHSRYL